MADGELKIKVAEILSQKDVGKNIAKLDMESMFKLGLKDGDLIVDIGYSATIQAAIEAILKIKMTGLYMQIFPETLFNVKAIEYFRRRVNL